LKSTNAKIGKKSETGNIPVSLSYVRRAWRVYLTVQVRYGGYQLPTISLRQGCPS